MASKSQYLIALLVAALSVQLLASDSALVGGWQPIQDLSSPEVQDLAKFAIAEDNKAAGAKLEFQSVVRGEQQVVAGMNYRLVIAALDGGVSGNYEAVIWVKDWEKFRNLTSFKKLPGLV
ncbi:cysteine proteinase inhibitor 1-like [Diospyros lotus]|uniref:cysteine proteinase inhibitor 1-like n=1 Tax=Diospyros lotus TaxID=55363 RepID=UPI00225A09ED|nr:cysteine proteinase inhibitor 1-like [Diospyros lotus]